MIVDGYERIGSLRIFVAEVTTFEREQKGPLSDYSAPQIFDSEGQISTHLLLSYFLLL
jgi:hypothetical protein